MLVIRLQRVGKKNQPSYRVILTEKSYPVKGKFIEILGNYNPRLKTRNFNAERIRYWLSKGAKTSATVHNLLVDEKIIEGPKVKAWIPKNKGETREDAGLSEISAETESKEAKTEGTSSLEKSTEEVK